MTNTLRIEIPKSGFNRRYARTVNEVGVFCPRCNQQITINASKGLSQEALRVKKLFGKAMCEDCRLIFTPRWRAVKPLALWRR